MIHPDLRRLDSRAIPDDAREIRLFAVMQNEELRLPYYFDYYRRLGVKRFFVIDNNSTDGTQAFLLAQPDACVFHATRPYNEVHFGVDWFNTLMDDYGDGHWIVLADADELLIYPDSEHKPLPALCAWLDRRGYEGIFTLLLDMYSSLPLNRVDYKKGADFLSACDRFDRDYHFVRRFGIPFLKPAFPPREPIGGPRLRLCFPEQNTKSSWPRLRIKIVNRLLHLAHRFGFLNNVKAPSTAPQAFKIPLVKWRRGYRFVTSHRLNPIRLAPVTGAMLHFKYFQDFNARVQSAVKNLNHYDGSAEYKRYAELMTGDPELSIAYAGSAPYKGSADLVHLGLIATDPEWDKP